MNNAFWPSCSVQTSCKLVSEFGNSLVLSMLNSVVRIGTATYLFLSQGTQASTFITRTQCLLFCVTGRLNRDLFAPYAINGTISDGN